MCTRVRVRVRVGVRVRVRVRAPILSVMVTKKNIKMPFKFTQIRLHAPAPNRNPTAGLMSEEDVRVRVSGGKV